MKPTATKSIITLLSALATCYSLRAGTTSSDHFQHFHHTPAACHVSSPCPAYSHYCNTIRGMDLASRRQNRLCAQTCARLVRGHPVEHRVKKSTLVMDASGPDDMFSSPINRRQVLVGGWAAVVGGILVNAGIDRKKEMNSSEGRARELFKSITEDKEFRNILEVGIGGNPMLGGFANLDFYRPGQRVVGIDPTLVNGDEKMLREVFMRAEKRGVELQTIGGEAEELPFQTGSFDAVVSTRVFCTVRDPNAALREVSRVLRPGGKFLFIEHVLAPEDGWLSLRRQQEIMDPLQQIFASGCHLTRETGQLIRNATEGAPAGRLFSRLESLEDIRAKGSWPISSQVYGVAIK